CRSSWRLTTGTIDRGAGFQLPPPEPDMHLWMHPALQWRGPSSCRLSASHLPSRILPHPIRLAPFAMWTAFPPSDYYGASVPMGLSPFRRSRVPCVVDVQVAVGALFVSLRSL